jgi:amino acid adenylation domain-containing protein
MLKQGGAKTAELVARIKDLSAPKRAQLFRKLEQQGVNVARFPIVPASETGPQQLSYAQQRQWFLWQFDPTGSAYNICTALHLKGELDVEALQRSLSQVLARHEGLRAGFVQQGEQVRCIMRPIEAVELAVQAAPAGDPESLIKAFVQVQSSQPFDLEHDQLLRAAVLRLADDEHVLVLTLHHIITDGWSMQIMIDELLALYIAQVTGTPCALPAPIIQYADYAAWQRQWLEAGEGRRQLDYWRGKLGSEHVLLELPVDRPRLGPPDQRGATLPLALDRALSDGLKGLAQQQGVSPFMLLLASFQVLLHRYSGQSDIRVGVPTANRNRAETERVIGFFVNTQVMQATLDSQQPFADFVQTVKAAAHEAQTWQDLPFEQLVEALQPERNSLHTPLFQVMFNHQMETGRFADGQPLGGLLCTPVDSENLSAPFDLTLNTFDGPDGLSAVLTYATDIFDASTVERMARHWQRLLQGMVDDPRQRIGQLPMLNATEQRLALQTWNASTADYPRDSAIHHLIEAQAARTPDAVALVFDTQSLTFARLNQQANRLAHRLIAAGVGPDVLVGIAVQRSVDLVVGLLAILKAGGAYVPLDPAYPEERLAYMMQDSGLALLLTQAPLLARLPIPAGVSALALDQPDAWLDGYSCENLLPRTTAEHLAYVIYTSGSTGKPKGVMVRHGALTNFVCSMARQPGLDANDRLLSLTTFSFDIFGLEIYGPLLAGATLVLTGQDINLDPQALLALVKQQRISVLQATPSTWRMLLDHPQADELKGCKLLCGGEALPLELATRLLALSPQVWNLYGPTETTIWSAQYPLTPTQPQPWLGGPIANTSLYILDDNLAPVPVGVAGELLIGGDGLARGYFQRPALTAERFLPDPFGAPGTRLYRTGDLARYRADGVIEYIGRVDHQVKIRGLRIELGEIEARLLEQPQVREAAVVARDVAGHSQLVAYVVAVQAVSDEQALREACKRQLKGDLPEYMVPSHWVFLDSLPLTPNGKLDRKALPAPDASALQQHYIAPRNVLEQQIAEVWQQVLGLAQVGVSDNFFELGGHSLLATQVIARLKQTLASDPGLRDLFNAPVLEDFAAVLAGRSAAQPAQIALRAHGPRSTTHLSLAQRRLWVAEQFSAGNGAYGMPLALRLRGEVSVPLLIESLKCVVQRHEVLRTAYVADDDGDPLAVISPEVALDFALVDLSHLDRIEQEAQVAQATLDNTRHPINLAQAPLLRGQILRLGAHEHVLLYSMHHIISDGWSMAVLVGELVQHYAALKHGRGIDLPPLPVQYSDYAQWQLTLEQAGVLQQQAHYWKDALAGHPGQLLLPTDFPRPPVPSFEGSSESFSVPPALGEALKGLSGRHGVTPYTTLLAAFQVLLHRLGTSDDLLVGADVAGRQHAELEGLIGFFVNILPLRSRFDAKARFSDFLAAARETSLTAFEHQDLPLDMIAEASNVPRHRGFNPLVQVLFVMNNLPVHSAGLADIAVEVVPSLGGYSKFDMALFIDEEAGQWQGTWQYANDLFKQERITELVSAWMGILQQIVMDPDIRLGDIIMPSNTAVAPAAPASPKADKLGKFLKKPSSPVAKVPLPAMRESLLNADQVFPLLMEPNDPGLDLVTWVQANRALVEEKLARHAGILFRGFAMRDIHDFEAFAEAVQPGLYGQYGDLPKKEGGKNTYRSTPYPEKKMILFHNESSHQDRWPRKQLFFCEQPSPVGGATPVVDCRQMYLRLPQALRDTFESKGLLYVRTFADKLDVSWQHFFKTEDRAQVEQRCALAGIQWTWLDNDELQIRTPCPAIITHPTTGEKTFFNQVQLHHIYCLDPDVRDDLLGLFGPERMPRHVYYGDGSPIEDAVMQLLGELYEACAVRFDWRKGDVILLDNMLAAHARDPFEGPRKIVVAMGEMIERRDLETVTPYTRMQTEGTEA